MAAAVVLPEVEQSAAVLSGQFVVVKVQQGVYAVPISRVQEIVRVPEITAIPATTPDVLGVINLRGRILFRSGHGCAPRLPNVGPGARWACGGG